MRNSLLASFHKARRPVLATGTAEATVVLPSAGPSSTTLHARQDVHIGAIVAELLMGYRAAFWLILRPASQGFHA